MMRFITISIFLCLVFSKTPYQYEEGVTRVIGVYTNPLNAKQYQSNTSQYIFGSYLNYVSQWGAIPVPIPYDASEDQLKQIFGSINGIIFTGGGVDIHIEKPILENNYTAQLDDIEKNIFTKNAKLLIEWAIKENDDGNYYPILGVCQGMELMFYIANEMDYDILDYIDNSIRTSRNMWFETDPTPGENILSGISQEIKTAIENNPADQPYFTHELCTYYDTFKDKKASEFYGILAYTSNYSASNPNLPTVKYIALAQAFNYPFFVTQFHPSLQIFEHYAPIKKGQNILLFDQHLARMFVQGSQANSHTMQSEMIQKATTFNWLPQRVYNVIGESSQWRIKEIYVFNSSYDFIPYVINKSYPLYWNQTQEYQQLEHFHDLSNDLKYANRGKFRMEQYLFLAILLLIISFIYICVLYKRIQAKDEQPSNSYQEMSKLR